MLTQAWERLERAEHERERVLRDELIRQEKLEQMARRFDRKAAMRETWLLENQKLVAQVSCFDCILWTERDNEIFRYCIHKPQSHNKQYTSMFPNIVGQFWI